jgi:hypothetical protein
MINYCCHAEMSGPDVQRNLDPRGLFAPHNDLSELLAVFGFQLRYIEISGTSRPKEEVMILQAYVRGSRAAGLTNSLSSARDEQYLSVDDHSP